MSRLTSSIAFGLVVAVLAPAAARTQSLGEVARQEEARRRAVAKPSKVYTNADLLREGAPPPPPVPPSAPAAPAAAAAVPAVPAPAAAEAPAPRPPDRAAEEKAWRARMAQARDQLQRSQAFLEALQSRINALTTDFAARDDPAQRGVIAADRQKALAELERVKRDIDQQTKAIAQIQEEARRAGVPPGWLR